MIQTKSFLGGNAIKCTILSDKRQKKISLHSLYDKAGYHPKVYFSLLFLIFIVSSGIAHSSEWDEWPLLRVWLFCTLERFLIALVSTSWKLHNSTFIMYQNKFIASLAWFIMYLVPFSTHRGRPMYSINAIIIKTTLDRSNSSPINLYGPSSLSNLLDVPGQSFYRPIPDTKYSPVYGIARIVR